MGLSNDSGGNVTWLSVKNGKFAKGKKGEEAFYSKLSGLVTGISFRDKSLNGKEWREVVVRVEDDGTAYQFGVSLGSGYGFQLLSKLASGDLQSVVTFEPTYEESTKKAGFFVSQGSTALKQKWTRDNPGDLPALEKVTFKGKDQWDDTKRNAWLEKYVTEVMAPKVAKTITVKDEAPDYADRDDDADYSSNDDENVPF